MAPEVFGTNYNQFSQQYAVLDQYGQPSRFINQTELTRKIYSRAYRVLTTDVLQLPEKTHITLDFELSDQAKKHYDELEAAMMTEIDEGLLTVSNGLVKLLRLQQITSGYLPIVCPGQPTTFNLVDKGKYDLMADLFDGITEAEPFIVFARFSKDLETIHQAAKACGLSSMELSGHKNQLEEWQNGQATVLAVQIQAGGAGIDLTRARYVCYFSLGYSLDDYEQSLFRAYRPGQTRPVTIYHLVARDTVDQIIMKALEGKANVVETILGGWKAKSKLT
jgi:SNF2 family DNA or RNA helicase